MQLTEVDRIPKNVSKVSIALIQNTFTQVKSNHPKNYFSKSEKVFGKKST